LIEASPLPLINTTTSLVVVTGCRMAKAIGFIAQVFSYDS
jgi:hypothetical protein